MSLGGSSIRGTPLPIEQCNGMCAQKANIANLIAGGIPIVLPMATKLFDTTEGYDTATSIWTCGYTAHYSLSMWLNGRKPIGDNTLNVSIVKRANALSAWASLANQSNFTPSVSATHNVGFSNTVYIKKGEQVAIQISSVNTSCRVYPNEAGLSIHSIGK